jgi:hypothetical protein
VLLRLSAAPLRLPLPAAAQIFAKFLALQTTKADAAASRVAISSATQLPLFTQQFLCSSPSFFFFFSEELVF